MCSSQCVIPANVAARFVAAIWSVLNFAGIVMTADVILSSVMKERNVLSTSAESSSEEKPRPIYELIYWVEEPIVRLNSMYTFSSPLDHFFVALDLSWRKSLYALSPTRIILFLV